MAEGQQITAADASKLGVQQIAKLTGKEPEGVTGVEPGEGGWIVTVEVLDDRRVPSSSDVLSAYETEISSDGDLLSYRRIKRYSRGSLDSGS